jgi:hypothetical protein
LDSDAALTLILGGFMGRLIGVGGVLLVLGFVGVFFGLGAYLLLGLETAYPDVDGGPDVAFAEAPEKIDPACLWPILDTAFSPDAPKAPERIPLQGCAPAAAEEETDNGWVRVSLQSGEPGDADFDRRFSGARVAQVTGRGLLVLQAYDNWGGSGVFSSLIIGRLGSQGAELVDGRAHPFGDRCTGGLAGTHVGLDGYLIASANMTPWDILMTPLSDQPIEAQWDAGKARFGAAFLSAPSCAICCSAVTKEYAVSSRGEVSSVGLRFNASAVPSSDDPLSTCLEQAVRIAAGEDGLVSQSERTTLGGLIDGCAGDVSN